MTDHPARISSAVNPRIKAAAALRERVERDRRGLTIVDGVRELGRAVEAGAAVEEAFACPEEIGDDAARLVRLLRDRGVPVIEVSESVLGRLAFGERAEGIVAVVRMSPLDIERLTIGPDALLVVLEGVEKPGNLGAVLRSADGAGADAVLVADPRTDPWNPNVIRASLGTIFSVPVAVATAARTRAWLADQAVAMVTARVDATLLYTETDMRGPTAIILGSEATGLGEAWTGPGLTAVRVPMRGAADSLNVSVTAAILLYEARRQRDTGRRR
jgi:TrmH family RNA methyltransferase